MPFKLSLLNYGEKRLPAMLAVFFFLLSTSLSGADSPFRWGAEFKNGDIIVRVNVPPGHHLYEKSTSVSALDSDGNALAPAKSPDAVPYDDEALGKTTIYPGGKSYSWIFRPKETAVPEKISIAYQGCRENSPEGPAVCFMPEEQIIELKAKQAAQNEEPYKNTDEKKSTGTDLLPAAQTQEGGLISLLLKAGGIWLYLAAFLGGILSALTPCVLPLIPVTLAVLGAGHNAGRRQAVLRSALYVGGLVATFTVLATLAALGGRTFGGEILGNPLILGLLVLLLVGLALSMLGLYNLALPNALQQKLNELGGGSNTGAFVMGLAGGLIAFPCTGPALAALLSLVAVEGNILFGASLMLCYGIGFGLPLFLMGCGLGHIRPGRYTEISKGLLGVAILCLSVYGAAMLIPPFQSFLMQGSFGAKLVSLLMIVAGFLMGAIHGDGHASGFAVKALKSSGALLLALGLVWNLKMMDASELDTNCALDWKRDLPASLVEAQKGKKPILIDFYADWCPPCKEMEMFTFPKLVPELKNWLLVKVDGTRSSPALTALQNEYKVKGYPTLVMLSPEGKVLSSITGFISATKLLPVLQNARQQGDRPAP